MDTLTHIVVGACLGEATTGKKLGQKALWLGAIAQSVPDIDFITHFWLEQPDEIMAHRGFTHSLLFCFGATLLLAYTCKYIFHANELSLRRWLLLFSVNLFSHVFIDSFNAYGTAWFEPFHHARISFHVLFVADPFFSIWPLIAFVLLLIIRKDQYKRKIIWMAGIGFSSAYLMYAIVNKLYIDREVRNNLKQRGLAATNPHYFTTPTPLNSWLWYVVASDSNGYYTGYRSVFDRNPTMDLHYFPRNDSLLREAIDKDEVKDLLRFARNFYTVQKRKDSLVFNVIRFGQVVGWHDPTERFAFYYVLNNPDGNNFVVQRGRFEKWDKKTFRSFLKRIGGN